MLTVACVLSPGRYDETWVRKLKAGVDRHLTIPHRFVCLTNEPIEGIETVNLIHDWPGWWSKIELFRPGLFDYPVLYLDLDTMVCGNIDPLIFNSMSLTMWREEIRHLANSSVMLWSRDKSSIYRKFLNSPDQYMKEHGGDQWPYFKIFGDQAFIARFAGQVNYWQKLYPPEWFHTFSFDGNATLDPPNPEVRLSICLGDPKFDKYPDATMVREHWKETV